MRLYLKLLGMVVLFALACRADVHELVGGQCSDVRMALVSTFGSAAQYEAMMDDTQRELARATGSIDDYLRMKMYDQLLAERLADARRRNVPLSQDDVDRLAHACLLEAFGRPEEPYPDDVAAAAASEAAASEAATGPGGEDPAGRPGPGD